jgi:hypothetical protein
MNQTAFRQLVFLAFASSLLHAQQPLEPPLKNWPAPLWWQPSTQEEAATAREGVTTDRVRRLPPPPQPNPQPSSGNIFSAPGPLTFIALTPCRVMDTRSAFGFTGAFGPPSLSGGTPRQVPIPSSSCNVPSNAAAYSLNITVVPPGPLGYLTVGPAGQPLPNVSTLNAPTGGVVANAAIVLAGTGGAIQVLASNPTDVVIDINGYYAPLSSGTGTALFAGTYIGQGYSYRGYISVFGASSNNNVEAVSLSRLAVGCTTISDFQVDETDYLGGVAPLDGPAEFSFRAGGSVLTSCIIPAGNSSCANATVVTGFPANSLVTFASEPATWGGNTRFFRFSARCD